MPHTLARVRSAGAARRATVCVLAAAATATALSGTASATGTAARALQTRPVYGIGLQAPLSGANAQLGINEVNGAALAIAQANTSTSQPFTLSLTKSDDLGDPAHAPAAASALVKSSSVLGVVGPAFSGATLASGGIYNSAHLATVSPSATSRLLSSQGWSTFHRVVPADTVEAAQAAEWLVRRHVAKVYVISDRSSYGSQTSAAFLRYAQAGHVSTSYLSVDGSTTTNYGPTAAKVVASHATAMYFAGYDTEAARLATSLTHAGYRGLRVGGNGILSSVFTRNAGTSGYGWYATCGCLTSYVSTAQKAFYSAYVAKYHTAPGLYAVEAYDATNSMILAIRHAVAAGSHSRTAVNTALGAVAFTGVSTHVRFVSTGDVLSTAASVYLFQDRSARWSEVGNLRTVS